MRGRVFEMDEMGLVEFVSTKDGALNVIEQLRGGGKYRLPFDHVRAYIKALVTRDQNRVYQTYRLPEDLCVHRVRGLLPCQVWFAHARCLGHRRPEDTKSYGRCHQPGKPLLYCSLYEDTALAECDAELGYTYAVTTYLLPKDLSYLPIGEFDYFRRAGDTYLGSATENSAEPYRRRLAEKDGGIVPALIDAFLADEFIQRASSESDYRITSAFADVLLEEFPQIDVVVYPSVAYRAGINFAVRPESVLKHNLRPLVGETHIIRITEVVGYGIYAYERVATLGSVNAEGEIEWRAEGE